MSKVTVTLDDVDYEVKEDKELKSPCSSCIFGPYQTKCMNIKETHPCKPIEMCVNLTINNNPVYFVEKDSST